MTSPPISRPDGMSHEQLCLQLGTIAGRAAAALADASQGADFYSRALERLRDSLKEPSPEALDTVGIGVSLANGLLRELHTQLQRELAEACGALAGLRGQC